MANFLEKEGRRSSTWLGHFKSKAPLLSAPLELEEPSLFNGPRGQRGDGRSHCRPDSGGWFSETSGLLSKRLKNKANFSNYLGVCESSHFRRDKEKGHEGKTDFYQRAHFPHPGRKWVSQYFPIRSVSIVPKALVTPVAC